VCKKTTPPAWNLKPQTLRLSANSLFEPKGSQYTRGPFLSKLSPKRARFSGNLGGKVRKVFLCKKSGFPFFLALRSPILPRFFVFILGKAPFDFFAIFEGAVPFKRIAVL